MQSQLQMAAMLVLFWLLILMMIMRKSDAASAEIITAHSGKAVLLTSDLQPVPPVRIQDIRWTHHHLVLSLKNNMTTCHHGRCELLTDGSLSFSRVQAADSGNYIQEVFDEGGKQLMRRDFLLRVEAAAADNSSSSSSNSVLVSVLICCFLLLLFFVIFFILKRRKSQKMKAAGLLQENVYVAMHSYRGNKGKDDEEKLEREEESNYVPCNPVVSMQTPITEQMSVDVEAIYV